MKIACVAYLHGAGGAERQITMLANSLAQKGHEVHLIALVDNKSIYEISDAVIVHDLTLAEKNRSIIARYAALLNELKAIRPDCSIHYWLQSAYFCAMMNKEYCGKIIYSERGDPGDSEYDGLLGVIRKIAFLRIDGFVFQSEGARDYFKQSVKKRSIVIHNAVSVPENQYTTPCYQRKKKIINVGRLHAQKNQRLLINAFKEFNNVFPDYTLEIIGDGALKDNLEEQIASLDLKHNVVLLPSRKDVFDEMYSSELFVLSSDFEGMPNVLLEAMSLGVLCIACDCKPGGARTLITEGLNGYIVPRNDVKSLSAKMIDVIKNIDELEDVRQRAQKVRETHTVDAIYSCWESFIEKITQ